MHYVIGNSTDTIGLSIGDWYAKKVNRSLYGPFGAIGFLDLNGNLCAAVIIDGYNGANANLHIYGPRCITKKNIKVVFNYLFRELKCTRVTSITKRSNKKWLKCLPKLNFQFEAVLKYYFGIDKQDDGIVYRMTIIDAKKWID